MFPLWEVAIAPVLQAAEARRVVEIGALRGETTVKMLRDLGDDAELHVIDPDPAFDPSEHREMFGERYHFHRALSLEVLPTLPPMDAALVDGDHNWYTVYNELKLLAATASEAGAELPVLVLHDVLWPYGRRDLYYAPDQIPVEHRQPHAQQGMRPGRKKLLGRGGVNPTMWNALEEGGERNGVMTGLDDFVAEHPEPLRVLVLPIYFGLAIVVEERRLARQPALAAALDHLEGAEGRRQLLEVAEEVRLRAVTFQHNVFFQRSEQIERATRRYLDVVKASLLDLHYLDHEVRFEQLSAVINHGRTLVPNEVRDPARNDEGTYRRALRQRTGPGGPDHSAAMSFLPYTAMGRPQLDHLEQCLDHVREASVPGDLVECGTGRGGGAIFIRAYLDAHEIDDRRVLVADRFRSAPDPDQELVFPRNGVAGFRPDLNLVREGFHRFGLLDDRVQLLQGRLAATLPGAPVEQVALLRIGRTAAREVRAALDALYDKVSPGGWVIVEDDPSSVARHEVEAFRAERGITTPLEAVDASAIAWPRTAADAGGEQPSVVHPVATAPPAPSLPTEPVDLTVVVVLYNMAREAPRTLHALSRRYQEGLDDTTYEVLVVDNGSDPDQRLDAEAVAAFGPEFRYLEMGDDAHPSPVAALNRGIHAGRGRAFALMIDGAHILTPGVLHFGLVGLATYAPAIVATQQWYLGPGQQGDAMDFGYDQDYEDRLLAEVKWPSAGHRLFEIGHFIGDRDWLDGVWESNCLFAPRALLQQVGGFDESFAVPGGGYANLELYERLGTSPGVTVCTIMGEGSFHQVHGGTTTNQPDAAERRSRVFGYSEEYAALRGRPFKGPAKPLHFVGRLPSPAALRSKPRRMSTKAFAEGAAAGLHDGRPAVPTPLPDELRWAFTEAVWRSLPWDGTTWLGEPVASAPTDLLAYQELITTVRPDWVIETGALDGGRSLFLASACELVGHGTVLAVGEVPEDDRPKHPRLRHVVGVPSERATAAAVDDVVGDQRALVILGSFADRATMNREFEAYAKLVPVGSYVIVTDTIVNGHPVWPAFGPGPAEAVRQVLARHGEFVADPLLEKYSLTFNPGGFLRRTR